MIEKNGKKENRAKELLNILTLQPNTSISQLATSFNVSEMTIRRDLASLRENNLIDISNRPIQTDSAFFSSTIYDFSLEEINNFQKKKIIAEAAVKYIEQNDSVILDTGTTTLLMAYLIPKDQNNTIISYNGAILTELCRRQSSGYSIISTGGYYHEKTMMYESEAAINFIKELRASKMFLSASGIHKTLGLTSAFSYESAVKKASIESSGYVILLVDSSKFDKIYPGYFAPLSNVQMIITNSDLSEDWQDYIREQNIEIRLV